MPRARKNSALSEKRLRSLIGPACFVECALAAGRIWDHERLEHFARKGETLQEPIADDQVWRATLETNMFRTMLLNRVPEVSTFRSMEVHLAKGRPKLEEWRGHVLWELLTEIVSHETIMRAFNSISGKHRDCLFIDTVRGKPGDPGLRGSADMSVMRRLYQLGSVDALVALVASAREARLMRILRPHHNAARYSRKVFPKVIARSPHLYIRWRHLALILAERVWCQPTTTESVIWFSADLKALDSEVQACALRSRNSGIQLPPEKLVKKPKGWPVPER